MIVLLIQLVIVTVSLTGAVSQLRLLRKSKELGTFSPLVPGTLIISSILKIFFWFVRPFATNIFIQNFLVIAVHSTILFECVRLRKVKSFGKKRSFFADFWKWETFNQYISFLIMLSLALGILTYLSLSLNLPIIADLMGYGATLIEIQLPVPQILSSYKQKSVVGVSSTMIGLWFFNDSLKTCYFIYNHQPLQFVMTGAIQLMMDIVLLTMIRLYGRKDVKSE